MKVILNGQERDFPELIAGAPLARLLEILELKADRVAVEHNGAIVARTDWEAVPVHSGDRLEVVHFVGGGCR